MYSIGDAIKHRAWKYTGVIVDVPFEQHALSEVTVKWDKDGSEQEVWQPAIMHQQPKEETVEEELDWGDLL